MISVFIKITFANNITIDEGLSRVLHIWTSGSSQSLNIRYLCDEELCEYHSDIKCHIIESTSVTCSVKVYFPYCLSGVNTGISTFLNTIFYPSVLSFIESYYVYDMVVEENINNYLSGPFHGIDGIRKLFNIKSDPLLGIILKPRTKIDIVQQKDIVKKLCKKKCINYIIDDELVISSNCLNYKEKINVYVEMLKDLEITCAHRMLYCVNVTASLNLCEEIINYAISKGIYFFQLNPLVMGFSAVEYIIKKYNNLCFFLINNVGRGILTRNEKFGISEILLAKITRCIGADAIYTGPISNNFIYDENHLKNITSALQQDFSNMKKSFAVCSGDLECATNVANNLKNIGSNVMIQIGGGSFNNKAPEKISVFSVIMKSAFNTNTMNELNLALNILQGKSDDKNMDKEKYKSRIVKLQNELHEQLNLRIDYKVALTTIRDPQLKHNYEKEKLVCEKTIIDFSKELNNIILTVPDIEEIYDKGLQTEIYTIFIDYLNKCDDEFKSSFIKEIDSVFEQIVEPMEIINNYNDAKTLNQKLEFSIPIIPTILTLKFTKEVNLKEKLLLLLTKYYTKLYN